MAITITLDNLSVVLLIICVLYGHCLRLVRRKLIFLDDDDRDHTLNPKRLLLWSVGLVCLLRIMCFVGVTMMDLSNVRAHYSLRPVDWRNRDANHKHTGPIDKHQEFYDAALTVLFDLPNCVIVSLYVLLSLVWAECFLLSRFHNQSTYQWKKRSLMFFTGFNSILYTTQMVLYSLVIAGPASGVVRSALYVLTPALNFFAVVLVLLIYLYANLNFAGYPLRSVMARRRQSKISMVLLLWSGTRVIWGLGMLYVFLKNVELLQDSQTPFRSALALFLLLLCCEILPILALLDYSYLSIAGFERGADNDMSALAAGQRALGDDGIDDDGDADDNIFGNWREKYHGDLFGEFAGAVDEPLI